jgi:hypothetical protein
MNDCDVLPDGLGDDYDDYYSDYISDYDADEDTRKPNDYEDMGDFEYETQDIDLGPEYTEEMRKLQEIIEKKAIDKAMKRTTHMFRDNNRSWEYPEGLNDEQKNQLDCITRSLVLPENDYNVFELMDLFIGCRFEKFNDRLFYLIYFPQYNGEDDKKIFVFNKINIDDIYKYRPFEAKSAHKRK